VHGRPGGEPISTASQLRIASSSFSAGVNSQLMLSTRTPVRATPWARPSAMAAVLP